MTRIGLIGCGNWGRHVLRDLRTLGCEVVVVARSEASRARAEGAELYETVEELPAIDGAVVVTPTSTHAAVVEQLLPRRVPVFVEKPLSDDLRAAERILARAPERVFVMDKWRYHPGVLALRDLARERRFGPAVGLRSTRLQPRSPHADVDAIWSLLPHDLAIALEVLGTVPPPTAAVVDPASESLIGLAEGPPWLAVEVGTCYPAHHREVRLHLRDAVAVLGSASDEHLRVLRPDGAEERVPFSGELPLLAELRAFVAHVRGGPPPRSSAREGALVVRAVESFRRLARAPRS